MPDEIENLDKSAEAFLAARGFPPVGEHRKLEAYWTALPWDFRDTCGWTLEALRQGLRDYRACLAFR